MWPFHTHWRGAGNELDAGGFSVIKENGRYPPLCASRLFLCLGIGIATRRARGYVPDERGGLDERPGGA
eukprot:6186533-Pleurochrysis_carterae.AAC.2